jgi:glycosyltransferase involved in cell wall biosynthesis
VRPSYEAAHQRLRQLRQKAGVAPPTPLVTAVIPTTGAPEVAQALDSAIEQDHPEVEILLVADGPRAAERLPAVCGDRLSHPRVRRLDLPHNTGADGFNGHRIYGACAFLAQGGWLALLDEDNWWSPDHLSALVDLVTERDLDWAYTLRDVHAGDGQRVGPDDCDSLGRWPSIVGPDARVLDTSTTLVRIDLAVAHAPTWYRRYGDLLSPDVAIARALLAERPRYGWTGRSTLHYRLRGPLHGPAAQRYRDGNVQMRRQHPDGLPWRARGFAADQG